MGFIPVVVSQTWTLATDVLVLRSGIRILRSARSQHLLRYVTLGIESKEHQYIALLDLELQFAPRASLGLSQRHLDRPARALGTDTSQPVACVACKLRHPG